MKTLELKNPHYIYLLNSFTNYLITINYCASAQQTYPHHVKELLYYLETRRVQRITQVQPRIIYNFIEYIKTRKHKTQQGLLSNNHINKIISACNNFALYLNKSGRHIMDVHGKRLKNNSLEKTILSIQEIKQLYNSTFEPYPFNSRAYGQRDRVMLAMLYGCGLRISEARQLNLSDIDLIKQVVFIKKAKGNKQRYVPIAGKHIQDIREYLEEGRNWFLSYHDYLPITLAPVRKQQVDGEALLINQKGRRMSCSFYTRLKTLKQRTGIEKDITPHGLRHSIATHLLQGGMPIEDIANFLGHASLDSTQIYTRIVNTPTNTSDLQLNSYDL